MITLAQIETPAQIDAVRALVREFVAFCVTQDENTKAAKAFDGLEAQLADLPGIFGPPDGAFLLASVDGQAAGCVALRRLDARTCEIKRMYLRPAFRGRGLGQRMVAAIIAEARRLGYGRIVLDTFHTFVATQHVYRAAGFRDVPPTFDLPEVDRGKVVFMERDLT